jgi:hypothetical protein
VILFLMVRLLVYIALAPLWIAYHAVRMVCRGVARPGRRSVRRSRRPNLHPLLRPVPQVAGRVQAPDHAEEIAARLGVVGYNRGEYPLSGRPPGFGQREP